MGGALERALPLALAVFCGVAGGASSCGVIAGPVEIVLIQPHRLLHLPAHVDAQGATGNCTCYSATNRS